MSTGRVRACVGCVTSAIAIILMSPGVAFAATWNSAGEASWGTSANWDTGTAPDVSVDGWVATLNSGTAVYSGSSFNIPGTGALMTLNGGSFRLDGAASAVNIWWGGKLQVNSGTFNIGTKDLYLGPGTGGGSITMTGGGIIAGTATFMGNSGSAATISGGNLTLSGDMNFRNGTGTVMSGGTLNAANISFWDPSSISAVVTFSGGRMNLSGASGVWSVDPVHAYVDFTPGSTGLIYFAGDTSGGKAGYQLTSGNIRVNGAINNSLFTVTTDSTGSYVQLTTAVPEPMSAALVALPVVGLFMRRRVTK